MHFRLWLTRGSWYDVEDLRYMLDALPIVHRKDEENKLANTEPSGWCWKRLNH